MEAPLEDETPAGALAGTEGPDHGEELRASDGATALMSGIGELSAHFPGAEHHLVLAHLTLPQAHRSGKEAVYFLRATSRKLKGSFRDT